jgi:hypothetical protein
MLAGLQQHRGRQSRSFEDLAGVGTARPVLLIVLVLGHFLKSKIHDFVLLSNSAFELLASQLEHSLQRDHAK